MVSELRVYEDPALDPELWALECLCKRSFEDERGRVDIYIFYFAIQMFPFHVWDYEPILMYYEKGEFTRCIYDSFHYYISTSKRPELVIRFPWRSFHEGITDRAVDLSSLPSRELTDDLVEIWRSRDHNPFSVDDIFLEDPWTALDEFLRGKRRRFCEKEVLAVRAPEVEPSIPEEIRKIHDELISLDLEEVPLPGVILEYLLSQGEVVKVSELTSFVRGKGLEPLLISDLKIGQIRLESVRTRLGKLLMSVRRSKV